MDNERIVGQKKQERRRFVKYRPEEDLAVLSDVRQITPGVEVEQAIAHLVDNQDFLGAFIKEATFYPVLDGDTQLTLARLVYHGVQARETLNTKQHRPPQQQKELKNLCEWGREAKDRLEKHNLRLVFKVARKYRARAGDLTFGDLLQEGTMGMVGHLEQFDPYQGYAFSTFITWWIKQAITRVIADKGRLIRLPVHRSDEVQRIRKTTTQLTQKLGREPTVEEVAKTCRESSQFIGDLLRAIEPSVSLETPVGEDEESELGDFIADPSPEANITNYVDQKILTEAVQAFLDTLPERERTIIILRYGLRDGQRMTLENLGRYLGVTRERARQLEVQIFKQLKSSQKNILLPFYEPDFTRKRKHGEARQE